MSASSSNGEIEKFLEKILEHQESVTLEELSAERLRSLAQKYGLDDKDYEDLLENAEAHKTRGHLFFENENWDDAIAELEQAYVVLPHDSELGFILGKAYAQHWRQKKRDDDRVLAEKLFRRCLHQKPNHPDAVRELTSLENEAAAATTSKTRPLWIVAAPIALVAIATIWFLKPDPAASPESSAPPVAPNTTKQKVTTKPQLGPVSLPANFPVAETTEDFSFEARSSVLSVYEGKYGYELKGTIVAGPVNINSMRARLELVSKDETVHATHENDIHHSYRSPALPGDSIPFRFLIFRNEPVPDIAEARLTLLDFDHIGFRGEVELGKPVEWQSEPLSLPPNYQFELHERNAIRSRGSLGNEEQALFRLIFTLTNTGQRPIEHLRLLPHVFDADGDEIPIGRSNILKNIKTNKRPGEISAVSGIQPSLIVGEKRVVEASLYLPDTSPEDIARYKIELLGIE